MRGLKTSLTLMGELGLLMSICLAQEDTKFRHDDPLLVDSDLLPIPMPSEVEVSQIYDLMENTFVRRPDTNEINVKAENVNTLGEVPHSSWFHNRMGHRDMTLEELVRGPNQIEGPDRTQAWTIIAVKAQGITPGFTIRDGRGDVYFIKFDPPRYPQLTTATEIISTKFFHALGYNVPENYLSRIRRGGVNISPDALLEDTDGKERRVRDSDIDRIFRRAYQLPDGNTPVIASRRLPGTPLGPFKYFGTRGDDPNDIFPHHNRRELRGLRVFAAWLNHDDSRSINTLDMYLGEPGQGHVKHHLIDFGSCLGSGSIKLQGRRAGNEYMFEWGPALKSAFTFGLWDRRWRHTKYPDYPAVGRFEGDQFQPQLWKPEYPNPAFERMQTEDVLWATRIVSRFSGDMIRALVRTGQIVDREAEQYLAQALIKRRDKIIQHYLSQLNPVTDFEVATASEGSRLRFTNLGMETGLASSCSYQYQWFRFDNLSRERAAVGESGTSDQPSLPLPQTDVAYLVLELSSESSEHPSWKNKVSVFLRNDPAGPSIVGIER